MLLLYRSFHLIVQQSSWKFRTAKIKNYKSSFRCLTFKVNISVLKCKLGVKKKHDKKHLPFFTVFHDLEWILGQHEDLSFIAPSTSCSWDFELMCCTYHMSLHSSNMWSTPQTLKNTLGFLFSFGIHNEVCDVHFMQRNYAICSTDLHHYFLWKWTKFSWKLLENYSKSRMYFASEASYVYILSGQKLI